MPAPFSYQEDFSSTYGISFPRSYKEHLKFIDSTVTFFKSFGKTADATKEAARLANIAATSKDIGKSIDLGGAAAKKVDDLPTLKANQVEIKIKVDDVQKQLGDLTELAKNKGLNPDQLLKQNELLEQQKTFVKQLDSANAKLKQFEDLQDQFKVFDNKLGKFNDDFAKASKKLGDAKSPEDIAAVSKEIDNLKTISKELQDEVTKTVKNLPDAQKAEFNKLSKTMPADIDSPDAAKSWIRRNPIAAGAAAIALTTVVSIAAVKYNRIANTTYQITSIKQVEGKDIVEIKYTPEDSFAKRDTITISGSDTTPRIDGKAYAIVGQSAGTLQISEKITKEGSSGTFRVQTTFGSQLGDTINDTIQPIGDVTGDVLRTGLDITKDVIGEGLGVADDIFSNFPIIGDIIKFFKTFWWLLIIVVILSAMSSIFVYFK